MESRTKLTGFVLAVLAASLPLWWLWDFTVDDALVTARVASHIAKGIGYRYNTDGPVVDAVTPLGWAYVLAPFAGPGPLAAHRAAKWLGAASYLLASGLLGRFMAATGRRRWRWSPLVVLACSAPLGAWAAAGMETGVVTALCTLALGRSRLSALAAGVAAAWRPELIPWAIVLAVATRVAARDRAGYCLAALGLAAGPPLAVAVTRALVFGQAAPLAVLAKPSDLEHGFVYALGALLYTGSLALLFAPRTITRIDAHSRAIALACAAHIVALILAGGDWMALYRLMVPVLPAVLLVSAAIAEHAATSANVARLGIALGCSALLLANVGVRARHVGTHRRALIERAERPLAGAHVVAGLDIGWIGAATEAHIVDLAGITDPVVAALGGGHTSKRIPRGFLESRAVDTLVLLLAPAARAREPWWTSEFDPRLSVQRRVAELASELPFAPVATLPLGGTNQSYLVVRTKPF